VHLQYMKKRRFLDVKSVMFLCIEKGFIPPHNMEAHQFGFISLQSRTLVRLGYGAPQNVVEALVQM
jgi:hypothetical protein